MGPAGSEGLTLGLSCPNPLNGIVSGVCAHRDSVHNIISGCNLCSSIEDYTHRALF